MQMKRFVLLFQDDYCDYEDKEVSEGDCLAAGCVMADTNFFLPFQLSKWCSCRKALAFEVFLVSFCRKVLWAPKQDEPWAQVPFRPQK